MHHASDGTAAKCIIHGRSVAEGQRSDGPLKLQDVQYLQGTPDLPSVRGRLPTRYARHVHVGLLSPD